MKRIAEMKVAVLMGGISKEHDISLRTGRAVAEALGSRGMNVQEVVVRSESVDLPAGTDVAFIALHGRFGEDGQVQELLERRGIAYTGSDADYARACLDKTISKRRFVAAGVSTPAHEILEGSGAMLKSLRIPVVIKPPLEGSSIGIEIVREPGQWAEAYARALTHDTRLLVETFEAGRELTVGILGGEVLPTIEIVPKTEFYNFENKYTQGKSEYRVPAGLEPAVQQEVNRQARLAFGSIGPKGVYGRVDLILGTDGRVWVLEVNTIPGMTQTSLLPKAAAAAGIDFSGLCLRILELSLRARGVAFAG
ncbi:MAG: D-alanine--D-alanine ligase [Verrucomicrobiae bacterium]|nr:D-alanine--D-alanine ligase [Verrucomicrobiae bacterium]